MRFATRPISVYALRANSARYMRRIEYCLVGFTFGAHPEPLRISTAQLFGEEGMLRDSMRSETW